MITGKVWASQETRRKRKNDVALLKGNCRARYYSKFVPLFLNIYLHINFVCSSKDLVIIRGLAKTPRNAKSRNPNLGTSGCIGIDPPSSIPSVFVKNLEY
jgi:hypothetical protein